MKRLTLATKVPADWKNCAVTQGARASTVTAHEGAGQYDALPGSGPITLKRAE